MDLFSIIALPVVALVIVPLVIFATRRGLRRSGAGSLTSRSSKYDALMFSGFYGDGGGGFGGGCDGGGGGSGCGGGSC